MWAFILHVTGCDNVSGEWYAFWSGFGADLGEFAFVLIVWRKFQCHADGCRRLGLHRVHGTHFVTCRKHHPEHKGDKPATAEEIAERYRDSL
jgi:hypothetical protein